MDTLIFSPHQDDEILSSFLLLSLLKEKRKDIAVVYITNGDYKGRNIAKIRFHESMQALKLCGISSDEVIYMGYGDTGMRESHSFINRIYSSSKNTICESFCSKCTYHPDNGRTFHYQLYHEEALYTRNNFINDLRTLLKQLQPKSIVIPSLYDKHYDHCISAKIILEITDSLNTNVYSYLIHSDDEQIWPQRHTDTWICPPAFPESQWNHRIVIKNPKMFSLKEEAIKCFKSQNPYAIDNFLLSFAKREEIFFPL